MEDPANPAARAAVSVRPLWIGTSVLVSVLVTITSLCGILLPQTYARETAAWAVQAVGQDCANLLVVVALLVSTYSVRNHSLRGYLVWLGVCLYLVYAFAIYAFAVHFQFLFLAYVAVLGLSVYTFFGGLMAGRPEALAPALAGNPGARMASALLFVIGVLFAALWLSEIVPNLVAGTVPPSLAETSLPTNPVYVLDLAFLLPGMVITSVLLWRQKYIGYLMAVPLLVFAITMGLGILAAFAVSALGGLPYSVPAGAIIGIIVVLGILVSWLFLRDVTEI
ncbi:MAG: hypothetical protein ABFC89_11075 [Methanospirillum sp.]